MTVFVTPTALRITLSGESAARLDRLAEWQAADHADVLSDALLRLEAEELKGQMSGAAGAAVLTAREADILAERGLQSLLNWWREGEQP